jgi:hypothetical protein
MMRAIPANSGLPPTRTKSLAEGRFYISDFGTKWLWSLSGVCVAGLDAES